MYTHMRSAGKAMYTTCITHVCVGAYTCTNLLLEENVCGTEIIYMYICVCVYIYIYIHTYIYT